MVTPRDEEVLRIIRDHGLEGATAMMIKRETELTADQVSVCLDHLQAAEMITLRKDGLTFYWVYQEHQERKAWAAQAAIVPPEGKVKCPVEGCKESCASYLGVTIHLAKRHGMTKAKAGELMKKAGLAPKHHEPAKASEPPAAPSSEPMIVPIPGNKPPECEGDACTIGEAAENMAKHIEEGPEASAEPTGFEPLIKEVTAPPPKILEEQHPIEANKECYPAPEPYKPDLALISRNYGKELARLATEEGYQPSYEVFEKQENGQEVIALSVTLKKGIVQDKKDPQAFGFVLKG